MNESLYEYFVKRVRKKFTRWMLPTSHREEHTRTYFYLHEAFHFHWYGSLSSLRRTEHESYFAIRQILPASSNYFFLLFGAIVSVRVTELFVWKY